MKLLRLLLCFLLVVAPIPSFAQTYTLAVFDSQFFDDNGDPLASGKVYSYVAGTTTAVSTYSNNSGTANTNPVVLSSAGRATIFLSSAQCYKLILKTSADVTVRTVDNLCSYLPTAGFTGSPMGTTATQTVSNKTLNNTNTITVKDNAFTLQDETVTTKQAQFQLSGISTATTRTVTLPDANILLGEIEVVFHARTNTDATNQTFFLATQAYQVTAVSFVAGTAEVTAANMNIQITKDTGAAIPGGGTALLTNNANAGFNGKSAANNVQVGALTGTTASLQLGVGNRLSVTFSSAANELAGVTISVRMKRY